MTEATSDRIEPYVWRIAAVVVAGTVMSVLDGTIVNVALHRLSGELHSPLSNIQWVVTGYLLALAAAIPACGWASRRFGARRVFIGSLVTFTLASALCGLASSLPMLVVFRVLQGVGGGMIMPVGQMIVATAVGPRRLGRVMGTMGIPTVLAPMLGPTLGGVILSHFSWPFIFYVNVPIGVITVVAALRVLPDVRAAGVRRLDVPGLLLLAVGMPAIVFGLSEVGDTGSPGSPLVIGPIAAGLALGAAFVVHSRRSRWPLLDVGLFRNRTYAWATLATFMLGVIAYGAMILWPLYFQEVRHASILDTGLLVAPHGMGACLMSPFAGRLADRFGGGRVSLAGVLVVCFATIPLALVGAHTPLWSFELAMVVRGAGIGLCTMPAMIAAYAVLTPDELADAAPQLGLVQRVGGSIGIAVLAVVLQRATLAAGPSPSPAALAGAFDTSFWWAVALAAICVPACVMLLRSQRRAAAAAVPPAQAPLALPGIELSAGATIGAGTGA